MGINWSILYIKIWVLHFYFNQDFKFSCSTILHFVWSSILFGPLFCLVPHFLVRYILLSPPFSLIRHFVWSAILLAPQFSYIHHFPWSAILFNPPFCLIRHFVRFAILFYFRQTMNRRSQCQQPSREIIHLEKTFLNYLSKSFKTIPSLINYFFSV